MLVITSNSPGEVAGWLRPLLGALYSRRPSEDVHIFFVPDDYATGEEPRYVRSLFPQAHVYDVKTYVRVALGGKTEGTPFRAPLVLYLGGDLFHAGRLARRFGSALATYKFNRRRYAPATLRSYAIDAKNAATLTKAGIDPQRVKITGNLAIDAAFEQAASKSEPGAAQGGIVFLPGSRPSISTHMIPFFFTAALTIHKRRPEIPIAFGISPFTTDAALRQSIESGGDWRVFAKAGQLLQEGANAYLVAKDSSVRFPVVRPAMDAAKDARLAVTIPGTNAIELAALGIPAISCSAANAPELIAINGPLTYLDRVPLVGVPLKVKIVLAIGKRFRFHTQPNMDAGREIVRELHGTLTPGRVANAALAAFDDEAWLSKSSADLAALYRAHRGASARMADDILQLLGERACVSP